MGKYLPKLFIFSQVKTRSAGSQISAVSQISAGRELAPRVEVP